MTWTVIYLLSCSSFTHIINISLVQQKLQKLDLVMVNKVIVEDSIECAFPNVEISLRICLTLVTNCTFECSFSQMKRIKIQNKTMTRQEKLESLSLLMIEADLLRQINFEDLIKYFANKKCRRKLCKSVILFLFVFVFFWNIDKTGSCWKTHFLVFLFVLFPL